MQPRWIARWKNVGWDNFVLLAAGVALCLCVVTFLSVARSVGHGSQVDIDERLMLALRNPDNLAQPVGPWWVAELGRDISAMGGAGVVIVLSSLVIGYLLLRRQWQQALLLVVAITGGHWLSNGLKAAYARERPSVVPHLTQVSSASFPSGHSTVSAVVYLTMGILLARAAEKKREKIYFLAAAFVIVFLIGLSRVFLGVHYPTDVLAGWSVGIAWALVCQLIALRLLPAKGRSQP